MKGTTLMPPSYHDLTFLRQISTVGPAHRLIVIEGHNTTRWLSARGREQ